MTSQIRLPHLLILVAALLSCRSSPAQDKACDDIALNVLSGTSSVDDALRVTQHPSCFFEANLSITPLRTDLWDAIESLSPAQQQGSSLSSSGSTNAVSKPSGPTALAEEFGGADVTRGTSSTTVQWAPGKMLANLALTGAESLCLDDQNHVPKGCISSGLITGLTPLTFKITANTSNGTKSIAGTATNPTSTTPAQQVNVTSQGASGPNFSGFTVQYSFINSRSQASVKSLTTHAAVPSTGTADAKDRSAVDCKSLSKDKDPYNREMDEMYCTNAALKQCEFTAPPQPSPSNAATEGWGPQAAEDLQKLIEADKTKTAELRRDDLRKEIENQYRVLFTKMQASSSCNAAVTHVRAFYAAILEAKTYDDFSAQPSSAKPLFALEYDLNTPQNKPSYSSAKATLNWEFGKAAPTLQSAPAKASSDPKSKEEAAAKEKKQKEQKDLVHNYAMNEINTTMSGGSGDKSKQIAAQSKTLAQSTAQPFSLTVTGTADVYHSEPSSSIPSASHLRDIQAGAEFAWVFSPFGKNSALGNFLGSATAAAAYSYEDQKSPAILTGPALSDFTGLPTSTKAAYAQRGVIHLGQIRLGFGTGKNLTYPLAFTYSNRTELITHPTWGVQFGITYNLTSLFNSSGTSKSGNASGSN
jgi:hypothetical protein